ncbi:MAG: COP23 domain-containing protein [Cyanobacteria bacterium P01_G01_bin.19]
MKAKYIPTLLVTGAISLSASPAIANSSDTPQFNFACQTNNGVPSTVAQSPDGEKTLPIFNWKQDALANKTLSSPQELCDDVTAKLEGYSTGGYDISQISFVGTQINEGLPAICATTAGTKCSKVLFTLDRTVNSKNVAQDVVAAILNPQLQGNKTEYNDRGVQSTSYEVNFWDLFNLNFAPKAFFK